MTKIYKKIMGWNAHKVTTAAALMLSLCAVDTKAQNVYNEQFTSSLGTAVAANGSNANWIFTNSCARSSYIGHTGPGSAYFQGSTCIYGNGGNTVSGDLITPTVTIGAFGGILTFKYYLENECGNGGTTCTYDVLSVLMSTNNGGSYTQLMASNTGTFTNGSTWRTITYNLPANSTVNLKFSFNSIDGAVNAYDGAYIDDINIDNIPSCSSSPATTTIVPTTTLVCPVFGTASFSTSTSYTLGGLNFTWYQSTGTAVGPYTAIPGATLQTYTTPTLNTTTYYQLVASCQFGGVATTLTPVQIDVAPTTTNTVPYYESFEGITQNGQLPNCSWYRSDVYQCATRTSSVSAWEQARTGTKFAEFDATNYVYGQTRYYYSNGILLNAGITYSASVWYNTIGYSTWGNFSLLYGPNQSPTGQVQLANISNPNNTTYQPLSNTFQVATTGMYYMSVKATEQYYGSKMVWDDLSVIAPCQFTNNAAAIALTGTTTICAGQSVNIVASGAATYTWSTGPNTNSINVSPIFNTTYSVTGINPLSGCLGSATREIVVNQLPPVAIVASKQEVCDGQPVSLQAVSANSYTWSAGPAFTPVITVTPTAANNTYTVIAANAYGCVASAVQQIIVDPLPVVAVTGNTNICVGAMANLTATGAGNNGSYEWKASSLYLQANPVSVSPGVTTTYSVVGTSDANCKGTSLVTVAVDICLGIQNLSNSTSNVSVYPNPNSGIFTVSLSNGATKTIEVLDVTGRVVLSNTTTNDNTDVNISALANGVYYVKVKSENVSEVIKVVKQ